MVIQEIPDDRLLEITLIENLQREDLNPIEAAAAFERLSNELHMTPEQLGLRTGKDRSTIVNLMRLLQLPAEVQELVAERKLSAGHVRPLLSLPTAAMRREVAERAVARGWSVRDVERLAKRLTEVRTTNVEEVEEVDPNVKAADRGTGAPAGDQSADRGARRSARPDRDRVLLERGSGPDLWVDRRRVIPALRNAVRFQYAGMEESWRPGRRVGDCALGRLQTEFRRE